MEYLNMEFFRTSSVLSNLFNSTAQKPSWGKLETWYWGATPANAPKRAIAFTWKVNHVTVQYSKFSFLKHCFYSSPSGHTHLNRWHTTSFVFPVHVALVLFITQGACGLTRDYLIPFLSFRLYVLVTSGYVSVVKVLILDHWSHTSHNENIIYVGFLF